MRIDGIYYIGVITNIYYIGNIYWCIFWMVEILYYSLKGPIKYTFEVIFSDI